MTLLTRIALKIVRLELVMFLSKILREDSPSLTGESASTKQHKRRGNEWQKIILNLTACSLLHTTHTVILMNLTTAFERGTDMELDHKR